MANESTYTDAPRAALQQLVKESPFKQKAIAEAVGERPDTFSKMLTGDPRYNLQTTLVVQVLDFIGVSFEDYARLVSKIMKGE